MENGTIKKKFFFNKDVWIAVAVIALVFVLVFAGLLNKFEYRVYDLLLSIKPAAEVLDDVVMVSIDNQSIADLGSFPWPRDIIADAIIRMRELGAAAVVFDIEYLSPSALGINPTAKSSLPENFGYTEDSVVSFIEDLSSAIVEGYLPVDALPEQTEELISSYIAPEFDSLFQIVAGDLFRDNDEYFGKALRYFGNSWLTLNVTDMDIVPSEELITFVRNNVLLNNVIDEKQIMLKESKVYLKKNGWTSRLTPSLYELMINSSGAGFTNIVLDNDGTRRRVKLLFNEDSQYAAQLVFAPIIGILNPEKIIRKRSSLVLENVKFPGEDKLSSITIPLDSEGNMLINWIKETFANSFKNEPVLFLNQIDDLEASLIECLKNLETFKLRGTDGQYLPYYDVITYLLSEYSTLQAQKDILFNDVTNLDTRNDPSYDEYFAARKVFFEESAELCDSYYEDEILSYLPEILDEETSTQYSTYVTNQFQNYRDILSLYNEYFSEMSKSFNGAFCIVGNTASASTDLGTTPFENNYPNIGTHANVYNTIMGRQFIRPLPWYVGMVAASVLLLFITLVTRKLKPFWQNMANVIGMVALLVVGVILMVVFNIYVEMVGPLLIMLLGFIASTILRFILAEKDKSFLRNAFSTYLSDAVVDELVNDPSKMQLGGEEKNITAMFTDIRGFSTISEKVTPTQLVSFLNKYLTLLSDIILENKGTIDKYEGDAIIAFFGAPIAFEDHAWSACIAAVRMKQAEEEFNKQMLADGIIPSAVNTRIGINSGDMVVGNMGTDKKMNYTMMGNDVNLAARLEGVNKVYHSWILVSEKTWNAANSGSHIGVLLGRRFDKVRVIGINTPVQLYNILGVKTELSEDLIESVKLFHAGLDCYFKKEFSGAKKLFDAATRKYPEDEAASVFSSRCEELIANGVPDDWDGVVNMTSK